MTPLRACGSRAGGTKNETGLGDYTEQVLTSIGVTKDRYRAAKKLFGLSPICNCDERREWLNKVSQWWHGQGS